MNKEIKNIGKFKLVKKYPELSPADVRARMDSEYCKGIQGKIDKLADELYELNRSGKKITLNGSLLQFELKAAILGGLTEDDIKKYDEIHEEVKNEFGL